MPASDGYIEVHYADVDNVGEALRAGTASLRTMLDDLEAALAPLRATWSGVAEETYRQAKAEWDAAITRMGEILTRSSGVLEDMKFNYQRTDLNLAHRWADIR